MVKKKRDRVNVQDLIDRPWCYYCDRDFDDQKVLIDHQKRKHFACPVTTCHRLLQTAGGLSVHMSQVHKENLSFVENAIEGRQGLTPEVFGMMGIPEDLIEARNQRIYNEFFKNEAEHRARTGNPPPGQKQGEPNSKRRKFEESLEDMQARKAAHKAKRAAERQAREEGKSVAQSASSVPDAVQGQVQGHAAPDANSVFPPNFQPPYDQMQSYAPQPYTSQSYAPQPYAPQPGLPMHSPSASGFPSPFPVTQPGQWPSHSSPTSFSPPQAAPYAAPPFPASFSPPQVTPYAAPPFRYPVHSPMTGQMPGSMMLPYNTQHTPNPLSEPQTVTEAQTPLQPAPGLPARPSLEVPTPNRDVMQRMHSGQVQLSNNNNTADQHRNIVPRKRSIAEEKKEEEERMDAMFQRLKKEYKQDKAMIAAGRQAPLQKGKRKGKPDSYLHVYSDNSVSPEEKMAQWSRYTCAF